MRSEVFTAAKSIYGWIPRGASMSLSLATIIQSLAFYLLKDCFVHVGQAYLLLSINSHSFDIYHQERCRSWFFCCCFCFLFRVLLFFFVLFCFVFWRDGNQKEQERRQFAGGCCFRFTRAIGRSSCPEIHAGDVLSSLSLFRVLSLKFFSFLF